MNNLNTPILLFLVTTVAAGCSKPHTIVASASEQSASKAGYERLKDLSGAWYLVGGERLGKKVEPNLDEPFLTYSVSSGGHSVVGKLFVDKPTEMISIYYLDMGRLNMDHYCSLGNQPRMVAVPGTDDLINFKLVGITDLPNKNDLHISSHAVEFTGPDELTVYWGATEDRQTFDGSVYHVRRQTQP